MLRRTGIGSIVALGAAVLLAAPAPEVRAEADYLFTNGRVYTVDKARPRAEAVAVEDRWISFVGSAEDAQAEVGEGTRVIDLQGRMLLPGFIAVHEHLLSAAILRLGLMQEPSGSAEAMLEAVRGYAASLPEKPAFVSFGGGDVWQVAISLEQLDAAAPRRPLLMVAAGGRGGWANSRAMALAGIVAGSADPVAGVDRDEAGRPTGLLHGAAASFHVLRALGVVTGPAVDASAGLVLDLFAKHGITAVYDAGVPLGLEAPAFEGLDAIERRGELPVRVFGSCAIETSEQIEPAYACLRRSDERYHSNRFRVRALQLCVDGSLEPRAAGLLEDYADAPGERGRVLLDDAAVRDFVVFAAQNGYDVHVQAAGDRAVRSALDVFASVRESGQKEARLVIGPSQLIDRSDRERYAELGVVAASTGVLAKPDPTTLLRLGDERYRELFPLQALADRGARVALGSDFPAAGLGVAGIDPLLNMAVAQHRGDLIGSGRIPPAGRSPGLDLLIRAYTADAAHAIRMEDKLGSIREGKLADLVVVDHDLFIGTAKSVRRARVLLTMMNGVIRHDVAYGLGDDRAVDRSTWPIPDISGCYGR